MKMSEEKYMHLAIALAKRAEGFTAPNPIVGALIVKKNKIIGRGYHHKAGMPHAEIEAIRSVKNPAMLKNADIYVTLEPCSTYGRTPPCSDAIINCGFSRVIIGCSDPNPKHAGRAAGIFQNHGINVLCGILEKQCQKINEPFFHYISTGKPLVILKMASTLDGKIATENGDSKWITGPEARKHVQQLRNKADAILIGKQTFMTDSPQLTCRNQDGTVIRTPLCFVASRNEITLPDGWERAQLNTQNDWNEFLKNLAKRGVMCLLIEGGGELAASALKANAVNKIEFHIAPKILGGRNSRTSVAGENPDKLADALNIKNMTCKKIGNDFIFSGDIL